MTKNLLIVAGAIFVIILIWPNQGSDTPANEVAEVSSDDQIDGVTIPTDIAELFPTYPEATVENITDNDSETSRDLSLRLSTPDGVPQVNDWYRQALSENGWSIKSDQTIAGYTIIQGEKNNLYTSMQAASGAEVTINQQLKVRN